MADKRYYWLKLHRDFFKRHDIRIVESMPNGKDYLLFYLKLLVESVDHNGELRFSETIPYNEEMLSIVTNTNIDVVRNAMKIFTELKMIEVMTDATIYLAETEKMLGSEAWVTERVRRHRQKLLMLQCNKNETACNVDIDIDKEIDNIYIPVIEYLNLKAGTAYKPSSKKTQSLIKARQNEGFTLDNFKTAIDKKCAAWLNTEWAKFLRPETLFGTKFEGYLNEKQSKKIVPGVNDFNQHGFTAEHFEKDRIESDEILNDFYEKENKALHNLNSFYKTTAK